MANAGSTPLSDASSRDGGGESHPPLDLIVDLLTWAPSSIQPIAWRDAFDTLLARRAAGVARAETEACLAESLSLLPHNRRRRFLRAPIVASQLLQDGESFDGQPVAELLLAELVAAGIATDLHKSLWTARGDRFLDVSAKDCWTLPGATLGSTGIAMDEAGAHQFSDDQFGIAVTEPHTDGELKFVTDRLVAAANALGCGCAPAFTLVTTFTEVLLLRREPHPTRFSSSTFSNLPGLVRLTNAHLPDVNEQQLVEALVHEAIHCVLHVQEYVEGPFVRLTEASDTTVVSPWTGATIRLQSYVHACAVWYGIFWLWSMDRFAAAGSIEQMEALRLRARRGFERRPVSVGLRGVDHLLTNRTRRFLHALEERMLSLAAA